MKYIAAVSMVLTLAGVACSVELSNEPAQTLRKIKDKDPTFADWAWRLELTPPASTAELCSFNLPRSVLGKAQAELADLRLADSAGMQIPFALRILQERVRATKRPHQPRVRCRPCGGQELLRDKSGAG